MRILYAVEVLPKAFGRRQFKRIFNEAGWTLWNIFGIGLGLFYDKDIYRVFKANR